MDRELTVESLAIMGESRHSKRQNAKTIPHQSYCGTARGAGGLGLPSPLFSEALRARWGGFRLPRNIEFFLARPKGLTHQDAAGWCRLYRFSA